MYAHILLSLSQLCLVIMQAFILAINCGRVEDCVFLMYRAAVFLALVGSVLGLGVMLIGMVWVQLPVVSQGHIPHHLPW